MKGVFLKFVFFLTIFFYLLLVPADAAKALYAVEPVTSHAYVILLNVPDDTSIDTLRPSLPGKFSVDQEGKAFLHVSPQDVLSSSVQAELYLIKAETDSQEIPINPDTELPFAVLTEEDLARLGLGARFGVLGFPPKESSEKKVQGGSAETSPQVLRRRVVQDTPQKLGLGYFILVAALLVILIFYIFWVRKKPEA